MTEAPKNQPTFHINQVGNLNTGDITVQGNQIGSQHNYLSKHELMGTNVSSTSRQQLQAFKQQLEQVAHHAISSQSLVSWAEAHYWDLLEGQHQADRSPAAEILRTTLADVMAQWESLLGNLHETNGDRPQHLPEFPAEWVHHWLSKVQAMLTNGEALPLPTTPTPLTVFFSYAHEDEALRDKLATHLKSMEREGLITGWSDRQISPGSERDTAIQQQLATAEIILLLISADFIASDYCYDIEIQNAIQRHETGSARVIPIILRSCDWQSLPFGKLQPLPTNGKPISKWSDQDEAFLNVAQGIRATIKSLRQSDKTTSTAGTSAAHRPRENRPHSVQMIFNAPVYGAAGNVEGDFINSVPKPESSAADEPLI